MLSRTALRQLMAHAASAGSLDAVYQTALRGVQEALAVERAALLVFDAGGVLRFVAWSGLSDAYRTAVGGHSPWSASESAANPDLASPPLVSPILIGDVAQDRRVEAFRPILADEGIRALAFIPLQFETRLLGKFMLYYGEPHVFSEDEVAIAEQIADHVAFALEHHRIAVALESRLAVEQDLRQRAETEAALREANERRLSLALAAGGMGAWDWDIRGGRVNWSSELESIHGLAPGTFDGTLEGYRRDVHPADVDRLTNAIGAALQSREASYDIEYRIIRPDGTVRWLSAKGRVLVDESGPSRMVGICRDVSERKRAQEASAFVADASRVLATTLAPDSIIEKLARLLVPTLADWCIVQVKDADGRLTPVEIAHQEERRLAQMWYLLRRWPSSTDRPDSAGAVADSGAPVLIPRITDELLDGRVSDPEFAEVLKSMRLHSSMTVALQARGKILGALTIMSAESGRVYDEVDLRFAEDIASWAALAIDNARLYAEARAAVRVRDEMAAFVSHDLRDPLQAISAAADVLRLEPQSAQSTESLDDIARASAQMKHLVQDLLAVSMVEAGRLPIYREPVSLPELVSELQALIAPQVKSANARLDVRLPPDLPAVPLDRHRILQVLVNLVGNALKFGTAGGVVTLGAECGTDAVDMWVSDTGPGIGPTELEKVFDRFWRVGRGAGAGLGLAVARGLVEAHGGRIGVESQVGVGSTFRFTLPLQSALDAAPAHDDLVQPPAPASGKQRVLLVDDDRDVVRSLVRLIRSLGHHVYAAFSAEEGLQAAEHFRPQVVLMDIGLPGQSGYDAARELRSKPWGEGVRLIAMTGWARDADRRRALDAGFDQHLTKPVGADQLEALLNAPGDASSPASAGSGPGAIVR